MSKPIFEVDRHDARESGRAIQEAQNTVMATGTAATIALLRELLERLKQSGKPVKVEISIDKSIAYQAAIETGKSPDVRTETPALSREMASYLEKVLKIPESDRPAAASIPLDRNVTITVDGKEVFRLKDGVVERNLLAPAAGKTQPEASPTTGTSPAGEAEKRADSTEKEEPPARKVQVEVIAGETPEREGKPASLSNEQRQKLTKLGVEPGTVEKTIGQKSSGQIPFLIVLEREVERNIPNKSLKTNLKATHSFLGKGARDFSRKVSGLLSSVREKLFPGRGRDLQNLEVVNVATKLLDRFGGKNESGKEVFDGNTFRLERLDKDLTVIAKDGRGEILSLKDGELTGSLTRADVEKFQAVDRQLEPGKSKQNQAEIG
ncbi:hypothetical protein V0288_12175 [Pannus brasiliensis CCIBt3594]|uniref:Uncharacterized protein n=1 Tax=Pannus brasiliensis CCIBt3594 TaxID=1427578 RepID=A0AAW9QRM6_9CHRO